MYMSGVPAPVRTGYVPPAAAPVTPKPDFDLAARFALPTKTGVRLHPRGAAVPDLFASKLGGMLAWPAGETWPTCAEHREPLLPVLQLRRADVPELPFPPGADLFQLLWCPEFHDAPGGHGPRAVARWRVAAAVGPTLTAAPAPSAPFPTRDHVPAECTLFPERVQEIDEEALYGDPRFAQMEQAVRDHCGPDFDRMLVPAEYDFRELQNIYGVHRSTKVGGFSGMDGAPECTECGKEMPFLLTLAAHADEYGDSHSKFRWAPSDLRANAGGKLKFVPYRGSNLGAAVGVFACPDCPGYPVECDCMG